MINNNPLLFKHFSHIYVENGAEHFADAQRLLSRFSQAKTIAIDDYKAVFNRKGQSFQSQKQSMKLILAVKKSNFIYHGSPYAPDFGNPNFYYNALLLNCVYNCDYCYYIIYYWPNQTQNPCFKPLAAYY